VRQDVSPRRCASTSSRAGWRVVEMRHDRKPGLFCDLECNVEGCHPRGTAGVAPHAYLDARDQIAVSPNDANALARIEEPQFGAFADRHGGADGEDAGKGDVEVGNDAQRRGLDHMASEPVESAGAGAASVHERRCSAPCATSTASTPLAEPLGAIAVGIPLAIGWLRLSGHRVLLRGSLLFLVGLAAMALSPWYSLAFVLLLIGGLGTAAFSNMQTTLILTEAPPAARSRVMGIVTMCIGTGPGRCDDDRHPVGPSRTPGGDPNHGWPRALRIKLGLEEIDQSAGRGAEAAAGKEVCDDRGTP